jgi:AraC-like DNA-binding protein
MGRAAVDASLAQIDLAVRSAGIALACLFAALLAAGRARPAALFGALFALGVAGYLTCSWPGFPHAGGLWRWPIVGLCIAVPALFWLFARALFEDEFQPGLRETGAVLALLGLGAIVAALDPGPERAIAGVAQRLCGLALVAHAIWVVVRGRAGDLVERRRRFRAPFIVLSGLYVSMVAVAEIVLAGTPAPSGLSALNACGIVALVFANMLYFTTIRPEIVAPAPSVRTDKAVEAPPRAPLAEEDALLAKLNGLMEHDRTYRIEGLTIGALAGKLGTQEYVLRRLVNGRLGYRNFSAFLNGYRLADAKAALTDPTQTQVPILTIALDAGFASLGPFNRAFKADTGLTPSEFRRKAANLPPNH